MNRVARCLALACLSIVPAFAEDPPKETFAPAWKVKKGDHFTGTWKWSDFQETVSTGKDAERDFKNESSEVEFELTAPADAEEKGDLDVTITSARLTFSTEGYDVSVTLAKGKEPVPVMKVKKPEEKDKATEKRDWLLKSLSPRFVLKFSRRSAEMFITRTDARGGVTWFRGLGNCSVLEACSVRLCFPEGDIKAGQKWDLEMGTLEGKHVQLKVDSVRKESATLSASDSGTETKDPFKQGLTKETTTVKYSIKATFLADGFVSSYVEAREGNQRTVHSEKSRGGETTTWKSTGTLTLKKK